MEDRKELFYHIDYPVWFALYTKPNQEKRVNSILKTFEIESFLPTRIIRTKNFKEMEIPLFRSYVFLKIIPRTRLFYMAMDLEGVMGYVRFDGIPAIIKEEEMLTLKKFVEKNKDKIFPVYEIKKGKEIEFSRGPFAGYRVVIKEVDEKRSLVIAWIREILAGAAIEFKKKEFLKWI